MEENKCKVLKFRVRCDMININRGVYEGGTHGRGYELESVGRVRRKRMSSNKKAREELERLYGKECFIDKLHLRREEEPREYKSKGQMKKMKQLSYHHILEKRNRRKGNGRKWCIIK